MTIRLGAVSYLNSQPLVLPLEREPNFDVAYSVPSKCARDLQAGVADVGLIPSIEYARDPAQYQIVPDVAIVSDGPVLTVRLFWNGQFERISRVALDLSSRTSVGLLRLLLKERHGLNPTFVDAEPDLDLMLRKADAALVIGDPVFAHLDRGLNSLDLGAAWTEWTSLPFVYAFWAGRPEVLAPYDIAALVRARETGARMIPQIATDYAQRQGGKPAHYERYLTENIQFSLGGRELEGFQLFLRLAYECKIIATLPEVQFFHTASAIQEQL